MFYIHKMANYLVLALLLDNNLTRVLLETTLPLEYLKLHYPCLRNLGKLNLIDYRAEFCTCQQNTKCGFSQILSQVLMV